jgi:hypothetical protein
LPNALDQPDIHPKPFIDQVLNVLVALVGEPIHTGIYVGFEEDGETQLKSGA